MNTTAEPALSLERPWPGMRPYREQDAAYFFGRDVEVAELLARTERSLLTLLYARAGLGKTSLLRAGLAPRLVERGHLPVYLRPRALLGDGREPIAEVIRAIGDAAARAQIEATATFAAPTLWELFHRESFDLWDASNRLVTTVLVFDQFEEIFQIVDDDPGAAPRVRALLDNLAELVENRLPARLSTAELPADENHRFDIASKDYRVILSFREDYLPQVRKLRTIVPSVIENHVRLEPLTGQQALDVVEKAGHRLIDRDAATMIVRAVGRRAGLVQLVLDPARDEAGAPPGAVASLEVDPAALSVVCYYLNAERQQRAQRTIDSSLIGLKKPEDIFDDYYRRAIARVDAQAPRFIETSLITAGGERVLYPMKAVEAQGPALGGAISTLLEQGILRKEWFAGEHRIEISHDLLLRPILESAEKSRRSAARRKRRARALLALAAVAVLALALWRDQRQTIQAEFESRQRLSEALLVAYVPLATGERPESEREAMAQLISGADEHAGGADGAEALEKVFDRAEQIAATVNPITARRLREVAVDYVQLKIDAGRFSATEMDALLAKVRRTVGSLCQAGFTVGGDRSVEWLAKHGGTPAECRDGT